MSNGLQNYRRTTNSPWTLFEEFDQLFNRPLLDQRENESLRREAQMDAKVDVEETDSAYLLAVDVPGMKQDDIKIDVSKNVLTISGERKREIERKEENGSRRFERSFGTFTRSFSLPEHVNAEQIEAHLEDGVLHLALPKMEVSRARSIPVQAGKSGFFSKLIGSQKNQKTEGEQSH